MYRDSQGCWASVLRVLAVSSKKGAVKIASVLNVTLQ
jgi:hypothetical protein